MELYVNDEKIQFDLEKEKNITEVLNNIIVYLEKNDLVVNSFKIDGNEYTIDQTELFRDNALDSVQKIEIKAVFKQELVSETIENIIDYMSNIVTFIKNNEAVKDEDISKIKEGLEWCRSVLDKILNLYSISSDYFITKGGKQLSYVYASLGELTENLHVININEDFKKDLLSTIVEFMDGIVKIVTYIFIKLKNVNANQKAIHFVTLSTDNNVMLRRLIDILPQISENFQVGNEKDGLKTFANCINFIAYYLEILIMTIDAFSNDKYDFKQIYNKITDFSKMFQSIKESLNKKDYVNLADIIEYELKNPLEDIYDEASKLHLFLENKVKNLDKK